MSETGKAVVVTEGGQVPRLAELHSLRDAGSDDYWRNSAAQSEEITLIDAERHPAARALRAIDGVFRDVGDWSTLAATFDSLPPATHKAVADELMSEPPFEVAAVSWNEAQAFRSTPAGAILSREWRGEAGQKLAVARERAWRVVDRLSDAQGVEILDWLDACSTEEQAAILRLLAGSGA